MKNGYRHIDPEKMTSQERLDRIVEILVRGGLRLVEEEKGDRERKPAAPQQDVRPIFEIVL